MKCVIVAALMAVTMASASGLRADPLPRGWISMFDPPYAGVPSIMLAISYTEGNNCFIPAGQNNAGFGVYRWDGNVRNNANFTAVNQVDPILMEMAITVGGTNANPRGVVAGVNPVGNGVNYFSGPNLLSPATGDGYLFQTQDAVSTHNAQFIAIPGSDIQENNAILYSKDFGKNFTQKNINSPMPINLTETRYAAIPSPTVMYATLGSWPNNAVSKKDKNVIQQTERVSISRNGKRTAKFMKAASKTVRNTYGYSAVVAKSVDAGNTWENLLSTTDNYYPNAIDCASDTHCVFVAEGFDDNAGAHIFLTEDGKTFKSVLFLPSTQAAGEYSMMSVKFNGPNQVFAAGSLAQSQFDAKGVVYVSNDGGKTWALNSEGLAEIVEITAMTFVNGVGFATAMTSEQSSTILRYDATGPAPTPAPTWVGNFTQTACTDTACSVGCQTSSFAQNVCLTLNGGGSAKAQCVGTSLVQNIFILSDTCTGPSEQQPQPLNTCLAANGGGSFITKCGNLDHSDASLAMRTMKKF